MGRRQPVGKLTENTLCHDAFCWPVSNSAVENRVSQDILSPRKSLKASSVATVSTDCHRMLITTGLIFVSGLVGASPRWLILELAYSRTGYRRRQPIQLSQCRAVENVHKNIYISA